MKKISMILLCIIPTAAIAIDIDKDYDTPISFFGASIYSAMDEMKFDESAQAVFISNLTKRMSNKKFSIHDAGNACVNMWPNYEEHVDDIQRICAKLMIKMVDIENKVRKYVNEMSDNYKKYGYFFHLSPPPIPQYFEIHHSTGTECGSMYHFSFDEDIKQIDEALSKFDQERPVGDMASSARIIMDWICPAIHARTAGPAQLKNFEDKMKRYGLIFDKNKEIVGDPAYSSRRPKTKKELSSEYERKERDRYNEWLRKN